MTVDYTVKMKVETSFHIQGRGTVCEGFWKWPCTTLWWHHHVFFDWLQGMGDRVDSSGLVSIWRPDAFITLDHLHGLTAGRQDSKAFQFFIFGWKESEPRVTQHYQRSVGQFSLTLKSIFGGVVYNWWPGWYVKEYSLCKVDLDMTFLHSVHDVRKTG